jgi:hypothetical protein
VGVDAVLLTSRVVGLGPILEREQRDGVQGQAQRVGYEGLLQG